MKVLNSKAVAERLSQLKRKNQYYAMYTSLLDGVVTDISLMCIPIDEHMAHRGDAVFEAYKYVDGCLVDFDEHMSRLKFSSDSLSLKSPKTDQEIKDISLELLKIAGADEVLFRLFLSRGPGSFDVNPYETIGNQLYIVVTSLPKPNPKLCIDGGTLVVSKVRAKNQPYVNIKSCNYIQNVLMKKELIDRGADFIICLDKNGFVSEGPTENVCYVDANDNFVYPNFDFILKGTTLMRFAKKAEELVKNNILKGVIQKDFTLDDLKGAKEVFMAGTTIELVPVKSVETHAIGRNSEFKIFKALKN